MEKRELIDPAGSEQSNQHVFDIVVSETYARNQDGFVLCGSFIHSIKSN